MKRQIGFYDNTLPQTSLKGAIIPRAKHGVLWPAFIKETKNQPVI